MEALGVTRQRTERLVRERIRLDAAAPEAFLRRSVGRARGFWARDDGWIAHAAVWGSVLSQYQIATIYRWQRYFLPTEVTIRHDHEAQTKTITVALEREVVGVPAQAYTPPS